MGRIEMIDMNIISDLATWACGTGLACASAAAGIIAIVVSVVVFGLGVLIITFTSVD